MSDATEAVDLDALGINPFSPEAANDPQRVYRQLRDQCPVGRFDFAGNVAVMLSRYEDVRWAMRHPEVFSSSFEAVDIGQDRPLIPLQIDPPEHAKYRRLLDPEFSPQHMAVIEPHARQEVNDIIDRFVDDGRCDFHEDFATPLPSTVFLALMGLPRSDLPQFLAWRDNIIRPNTTDFDEAARIRTETGKEIYAYFDAAVEERMITRDAGMFSRLLDAEVDGHRLTKEQILDITYLLILAGLDTVTATLDCSVNYLARHADRRQALAADSSLVEGAVEELLRWESPVTGVVRVMAQDHEMGGVQLKKGDHVTLIIGAADTDEHAFDEVDEVDFAREPNRHLAFGGGPHRCLGSHLARMELRVALEEWHRRIPDYELADGFEPTFSAGIRQAMALPLTWVR